MALLYPDILQSNNPRAYGIVKATEVSGYKIVYTLNDLYSIPDAILSNSGDNTNNDAIGQKWYVASENKEYCLINWDSRNSVEGWKEVITPLDVKAEIDSYTINNKQISTSPILTKSDIGLGNVDNTSDLSKPISNATQQALNNKQDTLISGTNIKTIDDQTILGSGNISTVQTIEKDYNIDWLAKNNEKFLVGGIGNTPNSNYYKVNITESDISLDAEVLYFDTNVTSDVYTLYTIPSATSLTAGIMSAADKTKLDQLQYVPLATTETAGKVIVGAGLEVTNNGIVSLAQDNLYQVKDLLYYGVQWDTELSSPHLTRVGSLNLHKILPIQSGMRGCVVKNDLVTYYLNPDSWYLKAEGNTVFDSIGVSYGSETKLLEFTGIEDRSFYTPGQYIIIESLTDDTYVIYRTVADSTKQTSLENSNMGVLVGGVAEDGGLELTSTPSNYKVTFGSNLSGYDGTVQVEIPKFYIWSEADGTLKRVLVSQYKLNPYAQESSHMFMDAYRCTLLREVPENMGYLSTLPVNSPISVVNFEPYARGWNGNEFTEATDPWGFSSNLGKPRTSISRRNMNNYALAINRAVMNYNQYKNVLYWLWVIEYANFNSQEAFNADLTTEGYHQGGQGNGFTNLDTANELYPLCALTVYPAVPCGYTNNLGNGSGEKGCDFDYIGRSSANQWINSWALSGCTGTANGTEHSMTITNITNNTGIYGIIYRYAIDRQGTINYNITGIPEGGTVTVKLYPSGTVVKTITEDGDFQIEWPATADWGGFYVDFTGPVNLVIKNTDSTMPSNIPFPAHFPSSVIAEKTINVNRWRGIEQPFGDIYTNVDGIIIKRTVQDGDANVWVCNNPEYYGDTEEVAKQHYYIAGIEPRMNNYIKKWYLGTTAEMIPIEGNGNSGSYMCDNSYQTSATNETTLLLGGGSRDGAGAGLACWYSCNGVGDASAFVGFRTVKTLND